jgi:hypothetical protein
MTFTVPFLQVNVEGQFGSGAGVEFWRVGFKLPINAPGTPPSTAEIVAYLTAIRAPITTYHSGPAACSNQTYVTAVSGASVGTDGKYLGGGAQQTTRVLMAAPVAGNVSAVSAPYSQAMCITLQAALARGRASKGRLYWPATGVSVDAGTGLVADANRNVMATGARVMIDALNSLSDTNLGANIGHIAVMSELGSGTTSTVIGISIGRKPDRQERREKNLSESHNYLTLATTARERADARDQLDEQIKRQGEDSAALDA